MATTDESKSKTPRHPTTVERTSDREVVVKRTFNAPARIVFKAWTTPELFKQWWLPKSLGMTLYACEMDVRTGGGYRLVFGDANGMAFHGRYLDVVPNARIVWTNDESDNGAVTTVTFEEQDGKTLLTLHELYPSKEAFEAEHGMEDAMGETFAQLDELLPSISE
jgi:uncharacterized protein YndB with AHSA1/START domain